MKRPLRRPTPAPTSPHRFCPLCGTRVNETSTRCLVCGTDLSRVRRPPGRRRIYPSPFILALLATLILAGAGLLLVANGTVPLPAFLMEATPTITPTFTPRPTVTPTPTATPTPVPTPTPLPPIQYTVQDGDSCLAIAISYDVTVESIILQNNLDPSCTIAVGHALMIPQPTPSPTPHPTATVEGATAGPSPTQATPIPQATYVVKAGDTCLGIALDYNLTLEELAHLNGISNCQFLREGQVLIVPLSPQPRSTATPTSTV